MNSESSFPSATGQSAKLLTIFLVLIFILRASTLETYDLMDPTEARYATVAAEVALRGDWVTPMIPMPTGLEPYLGKPPLHFWATAASYLVFGVEEWSARLPSLLGALLICGLLVLYSRRLLSLETGLVGCGVLLSSAIFFFFAGASIIDMTLTAAITIAFVSAALCARSEGRGRVGWGVLCAVGIALGFLTKGPVAICIPAVGLLFFSLLRRDLSIFRKLPWVWGTFAFLAIVVPWFAWSEIRTPGFLKYFFWNENIARYLFKEYGDLYGSGHRYVRGFAWVMLILAFLPWTPLFVIELWRVRRSPLSEERAFLLSWGLSAALFFTLVRQLHIGYVLPCLPPLALLMADLLVAKKSGEIPAAQRWDVLFARAAIVLSCLACVTIVWGVVFGEGFTSAQMLPLFVGTGMLISLVFMAKRQQVFCKAPAGLLGMFTASLCALYVGIILVATPYLNRGGSTETILRRIAEQSSGADAEVGVITRNTFSHYWVALASQNELPKPLKINFLEPDEVGEITNVLVKRKDFHRLPAGVLGIYHERLTYGAWVWLEKGASHKD